MPVKSIQLIKICNIISTTDHGTNHRCKLKIELETLMLFIWWTLQEISTLTTTCNALDNGIRIAHEATVAESFICVGDMYISSSCIIGKTTIIWTINSNILSYSLLYPPLTFVLTMSSFVGFLFLITINTLLLLPLLPRKGGSDTTTTMNFPTH